MLVTVGVPVWVGVPVCVGDGVTVGLLVTVGVRVSVGVTVLVGDEVVVDVLVLVGVVVTVGELVGVKVAVGAAVGLLLLLQAVIKATDPTEIKAKSQSKRYFMNDLPDFNLNRFLSDHPTTDLFLFVYTEGLELKS